MPTGELTKGGHEDSYQLDPSFEDTFLANVFHVYDHKDSSPHLSHKPVLYTDLFDKYPGLQYSSWDTYYDSQEGRSAV